MGLAQSLMALGPVDLECKQITVLGPLIDQSGQPVFARKSRNLHCDLGMSPLKTNGGNVDGRVGAVPGLDCVNRHLSGPGTAR